MLQLYRKINLSFILLQNYPLAEVILILFSMKTVFGFRKNNIEISCCLGNAAAGTA